MQVDLQQAVQQIVKANRVAVTAHIHPDGDSLGSMLALGQALRQCGKEVHLVLDDEVPALYKFLPGIAEIGRPKENDGPYDLLIALDASDRERLGQAPNRISAPVLNLDHHISNTHYADFWYVDSHAAAVGEIIFECVNLLKAEFTYDIALCLFTAIATDCGFFRYANTTPGTLRRAASLVECGVSPNLVSESMETVSFSHLQTLIKVLETLERFAEGKIAAITVAPDAFAGDDDNTEGFVNYPRNIEGVDIAILFKVVDSSMCRVSLRSRSSDVSKLAVSFGGGGHARAAGCTVQGSLDEVKRRVIAAAEQSLAEGAGV